MAIKLTEARLRKIIREEARKLVEMGPGAGPATSPRLTLPWRPEENVDTWEEVEDLTGFSEDDAWSASEDIASAIESHPGTVLMATMYHGGPMEEYPVDPESIFSEIAEMQVVCKDRADLELLMSTIDGILGGGSAQSIESYDDYM